MSSLPSGTVTFLFTDIEGSTKLAQKFPAAWEVSRARHHAIIRNAVELHGGWVFQIVGDGFCAAFHNPSDAILAAVAVQRALQAESWAETPIHVRMGVHTGKAEAREGGYAGYVTLATVQRVMSAAHGRQTLVSAATAGLLSGQLPPGIALRDLGEHRLKDMAASEHLHQLVAPGLADDFPPLKSADHPNNLPRQLTSLIGRERGS